MNIITGIVNGVKLGAKTVWAAAKSPKIQKTVLTAAELAITLALGKIGDKEQNVEMHKVANEVFDSKIVKFSEYQKI